jgi:hypothetical protein
MSNLMEEWREETENGVKYIVQIKKFAKKMKTFKTGEKIESKKFAIGGASFMINDEDLSCWKQI